MEQKQRFDWDNPEYKFQYLDFPDKERPDEAKIGQEITLDLLDKDRKRVVLKGRVTYREDYPNGYELDCRILGMKKRAIVVVNFGSPENDGVRLQYAADVVIPRPPKNMKTNA